MKELRRSLGVALLILVALLLTFKFKLALGWSPDFILPTLAVAAFFLDIYSLALFVLLAIWVLDWQAGLPLELWLVLAAPLAARLGKRFLPSKPWVTLATVIGVCEVFLYISALSGFFLQNAGFIISNILFAVLFGLTLLKFLEWIYGKGE